MPKHEILVLGCGFQGRAVLADLAADPDVGRIVAVDSSEACLEPYRETAGKVEPVVADVGNHAAIAPLMRSADVAVVLLPKRFDVPMAGLAVECGTHFVNASYTHPEMRELDAPARRAGVSLLPELGLDPGIDAFLLRLAVDGLDEVEQLRSYGAGLPAPEVEAGPLRYRISWSFADLLRSYHRPARLVREGEPVTVAAEDLFDPRHTHSIEDERLGRLEAFPNADFLPQLEELDLLGRVREAGRYTLRYPGHLALWHAWTELGFLDETPRRLAGADVAPRDVLHDLLEPQLHYGPDERDLVLLRVEAVGRSRGRRRRVVTRLIDFREADGGLLAMQRTVGFTAAIGALMLARGEVDQRGLLAPVRDVPVELLRERLARRGLQLEVHDRPLDP